MNPTVLVPDGLKLEGIPFLAKPFLVATLCMLVQHFLPPPS